jgi:hypothetical protein
MFVEWLQNRAEQLEAEKRFIFKALSIVQDKASNGHRRTLDIQAKVALAVKLVAQPALEKQDEPVERTKRQQWSDPQKRMDRYRERNREHAKKSRKQKKIYTETLQQKVKEQQAELEVLRSELYKEVGGQQAQELLAYFPDPRVASVQAMQQALKSNLIELQETTNEDFPAQPTHLMVSGFQSCQVISGHLAPGMSSRDMLSGANEMGPITPTGGIAPPTNMFQTRIASPAHDGSEDARWSTADGRHVPPVLWYYGSEHDTTGNSLENRTIEQMGAELLGNGNGNSSIAEAVAAMPRSTAQHAVQHAAHRNLGASTQTSSSTIPAAAMATATLTNGVLT